MSLPRLPLLLFALLVATAPCQAAKPIVRDGSTKAKAIPLTERDPAKAVEQEMAWMMKLFHYTPILATRDALTKAIRELKAGKAKTVNLPHNWGHATVDYNGRLISDWWFPSPHGKREIFFDTGTLINTPGEVARQESARAAYLGRILPTLKLQ
ncbi:MAG TPA: hypothetical protein VF511_10190 [Chthoniobacterales bacterium]|jgi:hypothetical protein